MRFLIGLVKIHQISCNLLKNKEVCFFLPEFWGP